MKWIPWRLLNCREDRWRIDLRDDFPLSILDEWSVTNAGDWINSRSKVFGRFWFCSEISDEGSAEKKVRDDERSKVSQHDSEDEFSNGSTSLPSTTERFTEQNSKLDSILWNIESSSRREQVVRLGFQGYKHLGDSAQRMKEALHWLRVSIMDMVEEDWRKRWKKIWRIEWRGWIGEELESAGKKNPLEITMRLSFIVCKNLYLPPIFC